MWLTVKKTRKVVLSQRRPRTVEAATIAKAMNVKLLEIPRKDIKIPIFNLGDISQ